MNLYLGLLGEVRLELNHVTPILVNNFILEQIIWDSLKVFQILAMGMTKLELVVYVYKIHSKLHTLVFSG